jgi:hypothetical protein
VFLLIVAMLILASLGARQFVNRPQGAQWIAGQLEAALGTKVSIESIHLGFFGGFSAKGFLIRDHRQDTLIYSHEVYTDVKPILVNTSDKKLNLGKVKLVGAVLNLTHYMGDPKNNLGMTFSPPSSVIDTTPRSPFTMDLGSLDVHDFVFYNYNENRGSFETYRLDEGNFEVNELKLDSNIIDLHSVGIFCLDFHLNMEEVDDVEVVQMDSEETEETEVNSEKAPPLQLRIENFTLRSSDFTLHNNARTPEWSGNFERIDYDHMKINNINIDVEDFQMVDLAFKGRQAELSLVSPTGFELNSMRIAEASVDSAQMVMHGLDLVTPYSHLKDSLVFTYNCFPAWRNFNEEIFIQGNLNQSEIALRDIMCFAPALYDNTFFINSEREIIQVNGKIFGRINSLKSSDLTMNVGDEILFQGRVSTRDLAVNDEQFFGLDIQRLQFDIKALEKLVPGLELPSHFERLEDINYTGRFDGYFLDFVTFGKLESALGSADLDMRLDLKPGSKKAQYSGKLAVNDFDLKGWTLNPDLGSLGMNMVVEEGQGLDIESAEVDLNGNIDFFDFKGFRYTDMKVNGALSKSSFDGKVTAGMPSASFVFDGRITGLDSVPVYDFAANIDHLRLDSLNLSKKAFDLGGKTRASFKGLSWKELIGEASMENIWMVYGEQDTLKYDRISIAQTEKANGRVLELRAPFGAMKIEGAYDLPKLHQDAITILRENHGQLADLIKLPTYTIDTTKKFVYNLAVMLNDPQHTLAYFTNDGYDFAQMDIEATVSTVDESIRLQGHMEDLRIGKTLLSSTDLSFINDGPMLIYKLDTDTLLFNDQPMFFDFANEGNFNRDQGLTRFTVIDANDVLEDINVQAEFEPVGNELMITLDPTYFVYTGETWRFLPGNSLTVGKKSLKFDDFVLSSFRQVLILEDINEGKGLHASIEDFSTDFLDSLVALKGFDFDGRFNADLTVGDLFEFRDIDFSLQQDKFILNGKEEGELEVWVSGESFEKGLEADITIDDGKKSIIAKGNIGKTGYDLDVAVEKYPLSILEYIITSGISGTHGDVSGKVKVKGSGGSFDIIGDIVASGGTRIDYIGVAYKFEEQTVSFKEDFLDFTGTVIKDKYGNQAKIRGGLGHSSFKDWSLDVSLNSQRLLMMETTAEENPFYYGTAFGNGTVEFLGTFENPYIYVQAETRPGTNLVIPISSGSSDTQSDFIQFTNTSQVTEDDTSSYTIKGLELEMKLSVTDDASMKIIFDEKAGDILQGTGRGNMVVKLERTGELKVYGDYEIEQGDYLFTLLNFVNKPFIVERGGRIRWTGDPIDAQIDLTAEYKDLSASPYPLIQEYANNQALTDAQRSTRVELKMDLQGSLLRPLINFDIQLPELIGEVKTYTENKLQILKSDQNALNQQVFGLVVFGTFLPTVNAPSLATNLGASTVNTLSEFLSTQLSFFVSGLLNNIVDDVNFISGIDVDLAYIQRYDLQAQQSTFNDGEYQFRVKNRLWNDRWVVTLGGNYGNQSILNADPYFNPETVIEWNTPVKGLKLRVYYRGEDSLQGQRQLVGGGIRYRKEFDSFSDFTSALKSSSKAGRTEQ